MNKQSFITILLTVLISMTGAKAFAHDIEVANSDGKTIYYVWTNNNTELAVSYRGSYGSDYSYEYSGNVIIPSSVVYNGNTYSVTSIGNETFFNCSLTSVTIPNSVTSIGSSAFEGCSGLTSVTIPNSVTSIGGDAFDWCSGLTSVTIPNSVTSIGDYAFSGCSGLTSIVVETGNAKYDSRDNCNAIIETSSNALIAGCQNTIIPNSVTSIGKYAFDGCSGLTSVTIPNSVTSIGNLAFYLCSGLTSVTIPNSVTEISDDAFYYCRSLTSVTIPNSVTYIGRDAFYGCYELTDVYCQAEKLRNNKWSGEGLYTNPYAFSFPQAMTLHVPAASIEAYKAIEPWNDFMSIVALEGISIHGDVTGNGTVDDEDIAFVLNCIINSIFDTKADINHDSKVNVADLVDIVNIIKNNGAQKY